MWKSSRRKPNFPNKIDNCNISSIKITFIYLIIGLSWIYFSEQVIVLLAGSDGYLLTRMEVYKGWFYILMTSVILYLLIRSQLKKVEATEKALNDSYEQLSSTNTELQAYIQQLAASEEQLRAQYEQLMENEQLLSRSEEKNRAIIQALPDLLFVLDGEGRFMDCKTNDKALLMMPRELFIGKSVDDIMPEEIAAIAMDKIKLVLKTGNIETFEYTLEVKGKNQHYELRMAKSSKNEVLAISRNVTEERERENQLIASEDKYKTLVTQMLQGLSLYEAVTDGENMKFVLLDCNESYERITGTNIKIVIGKNITDIIPDLESEYLNKFKRVVITGEPDHYERYSKNAGKYIEVVAYRPKESQLALIVGDITQRKLAEDAVKASEYTFRNLFLGSSDGIMLLKNHKVIDCNPAMLELLRYDSKNEIYDKILSDLAPEVQPDGENSREVLDKVRNEISKYKKCKFEWWSMSSNHELIPLEIMITSIMLNGQEVYHCLCRDVRERKLMEQKLEYLSYHDQLTGLYNRRFFEEELVRLDVQRNYPLTLVMADVNGLKLVNDSFGHAMGDRLLKKVSQVLSSGCRADDIVARLGGDEFMILLPKTDGFEAESIIKRIKELALSEKVDSIDISVSMGYETKNNSDENVDEIFKRAEDHMYKNKLFESPSMRGRTINTIISTLHEKNKREEQHSKRVSFMCERMGQLLGLDEEQVHELKTVGLLHDIGKIAVDENILNKPSPLDDSEWEEIKRHPEVGYRILSTVNNMSEMAEFVLAHHERWDGKGYPKGLKQDQIPLQSRIISIVDAFDAMTSTRTYGYNLTRDEAYHELKENAGTQFDPALVDIFLEKVI